MPEDDQGTGIAANADQSASQDNGGKKNPFSDVQNILGFLLAGFGGIISFLGLRSTEVTTVLRNDPGPASLVAAFLLLGVLAAVLTVAIDSGTMQNASWADAIGTAFLLIGLADFIIYAIPASASPSQLSEVLAPTFVALGITVLGASFWAKRMSAAQGGAHGIPPTIIFLIISVTLIALSAYGAMRLETGAALLR